MASADLPQRMTALDASFLYLERPNALLHVGAIFTFARKIELPRLVAYMAERIALVPRYAQRAVMVPLNLNHPVWENDPDFEIHDHVIHHHLHGKGKDEDLARLCAKLFAEPLDRQRPLWEMHIIDGYGEGCALLSKTHHAMIDGASGVQLTNLLLDPSPKPSTLPKRFLPKADGLSHPIQRAAAAVADRLSTQLGLVSAVATALAQPQRVLAEARETVDAFSTLTRSLAEAPRPAVFNGELSQRRDLAWAPLSLAEIRAIKGRLGGTVNDVILSIIAGGLRQYLIELGEQVGSTVLKAVIPVSVRGESERQHLGNRVSTLLAPLPLGVADPVERLRQISAATELLKESGQSRQLQRLLGLAELLPPILQAPLAALQDQLAPANTICTNVPGPGETRYLLGEPVQLMVPLVPLGARIGLGFAILSYANQITIGINADAGLVANAWRVAQALQHSFEELWQATGLERRQEPARVESALQRRARLGAHR